MVRRLSATILTLAAWASVAVEAPAQSMPVAEEFERLHFRSIGPATMSGRIADLAVYEANPAVYYAATAHGGVWKTTSNGAMWTPLFQNEGLISTGDVTISQRNPDLVWVGAGESNNRQSTSWGGGVYKSTDGGRTFTHMGLPNSRHINRILIDPANDEVVLVAATGPLFGPGGDRGIYKTTNGGRSWTKVLSVDDDTGANDLVMSATDPRTMYASTYQRRRTGCCMNGGGPGSAIWKSTNGGDTWTRLQSPGLPVSSLGRIALDTYRKNGNIVFASIEGPSQGRGGGGGEESPDTAAAGGRGGRAGGAPAGGQPGITGVYRSDDAGATWRRVSGVNPRPMYFSQIRIDPNNPEHIYMGGVGMQMSLDGGRTFETDAALVTHDDIHAIWINPANSDHILIGNDGGIAVSYDKSKTWVFIPNLPVGLFYHVSYDMEIPYNVCGGMQDNYNWCGPSVSRLGRGIMNYDWFQVQGGDGFVAMPDLKDSRIIYTESQGGNMIRRNKVTGESKSIRPAATNVTNFQTGDNYRFNWDSPMILSPHDPGTLLVAANRLFKSTDRGDTWLAISPDLTKNENRNDLVTMGLKNSEINISRNDGISSWGTLVSIAESPKQPGLYYTGSDDGTVSMSRDGGKTWQNITSKLPGYPKDGWVSEVVPSRFEAGRVYVTVDNHLNNDYDPYMWVSDDFGATFRSIVSNLRGENVRTLTEDTKNPDVLYIGTETGIFLSLDRGASWRRLKANLPTVRVDEITLHPRDNAMLVATHGRALWILDHLEPIQEYAAATRATANAKLFSIPSALQWKQRADRNEQFWGHQFFIGENPPADAVIQFYVKQPVNDIKLRITNAAGQPVRELTAPANRRQPGIQTVCWDMRVEPIQTPPDSAAAAPGRGGGGGGGGRGGGGGTPPIAGIPVPLPTAGYLPANPCAAGGGEGGGGGGGGGGRGGGGGGGGAGPHVNPGTYNVALVVDGRAVETKPMRVIMDPMVPFTVAQRTRYNEIVNDLHDMQRRGTPVAAALTSLAPQMADIAGRIGGMDVPAAVKTQFEALNRDFNAVRMKFGVAAGAAGGGAGAGGRGAGGGGGGGGGGRGGGAAPDPANVFGKVSTLKGSIMGIWEMPSTSLVGQYNEVKLAFPTAMTQANAVLTRARTLSQTLQGHGITLRVPPAR